MLSDKNIVESIEAHNARNVGLLQVLKEKIPIDESRSTELHFWAPDQNRAALLARAIYNLEYLVTCISLVDLGDGSQVWTVDAEVVQRPIDAGGSAFTEQMVRLAAEYDAEFDGWGTVC